MMRYKWIDIARGLAMLMVIIGHVSGSEPAFQAGQNFLFLGNLPIFFFFSGLLYRPKPLGERIKTNFNTLILLYIVFALLILAYEWPAVKFGHASWSLTGTLLGALWAGGNNSTMPAGMMSLGAVWFFVALGLATIVFSCVQALVAKLPDRWRMITLVVISLGLFGLGLLAPAVAPWSLNAVLLSQVFLLGGYLAQRWMKQPWPFYGMVTMFVAGLAVWYWASQAGTFYLVSGTFTGPIWQMLLGAFGSIFALAGVAQLIERGLWQMGDGIAWVGQNSAVVLFLHAFAILILGKIVYGPTVGLWVQWYGRPIAWVLMVLLNTAPVIVMAYVALGLPIVRKIFTDRRWPMRF
ncbi:acyltransferase family protein [Weissella cibaria]|uniref:acyltransferase family protein n=1 Tax=Weissella cibaria TaxID=137591 RepID=UPI0021C0675E|nr:acyltransferase family protein [Weissella cibaria]